MKSEELKEGLIIWWTTDRPFKPWSCPGMITYLNHQENIFNVYVFDELEEIKDLKIVNPPCGCCPDPPALSEMRLSSKEELIQYLTTSIIERNNAITAYNNKIKSLNKEKDIINDLIGANENNILFEFISKSLNIN